MFRETINGIDCICIPTEKWDSIKQKIIKQRDLIQSLEDEVRK